MTARGRTAAVSVAAIFAIVVPCKRLASGGGRVQARGGYFVLGGTVGRARNSRPILTSLSEKRVLRAAV